MTLKISPDGMKEALNQSGWLPEPVVAAGQLRQGKAPSMLAMASGVALIEVLRPRRSKQLPRHFVLAVTDGRVVAFKASGGSPKDSTEYELRIQPGEVASFPRASVRVEDLTDGVKSKDATLVIGDERIPVTRPNLSGDSNTDELLGLLSGAA